MGHRAKDYPTTNKKKDKINMLELEEEVQNKLYSILEENENKSSSDENLCDDDQLNIVYSSYNSKSYEVVQLNHSINVIIGSNKETFFYIIDHIKDLYFKKKIT